MDLVEITLTVVVLKSELNLGNSLNLSEPALPGCKTRMLTCT